MIDIYKIIEKTSVEGPGLRFCIWTQGCKKHCKNCWAKDTWEFGIGKKYQIDELFTLIRQQKNIEGVTFLGGEPFEQAKELSRLAEKIKSINLTVVCFTGYTLEELKAKKDIFTDKFLSNIDLLIDGGFEEKNFDISRPWVGSSNQRYIFLTDTYSFEQIKNYKNKIEVRIAKSGKLEINGMGDFNQIQKKFCLQPVNNNVK